jgi:hypothetical protein
MKVLLYRARVLLRTPTPLLWGVLVSVGALMVAAALWPKNPALSVIVAVSIVGLTATRVYEQWRDAP